MWAGLAWQAWCQLGWGHNLGTSSPTGYGVLTLLLPAGQHRSLGSNISKVQSLKLDTSVWSNEIVQVRHSGQGMVCPEARLLLGQGSSPTVSSRNIGNPAPPADPGARHDHGALPQLFIVLGNDRANRFWAARLPATEAITPDSGAEHRRDFIARKYREGRYRLPHPHYATQEEVLQVGDTSRCWQTPQNSWSEVPAPPAWLPVLTPSCQAGLGRLCPGLAALEQL